PRFPARGAVLGQSSMCATRTGELGVRRPGFPLPSWERDRVRGLALSSTKETRSRTRYLVRHQRCCCSSLAAYRLQPLTLPPLARRASPHGRFASIPTRGEGCDVRGA